MASPINNQRVFTLPDTSSKFNHLDDSSIEDRKEIDGNNQICQESSLQESEDEKKTVRKAIVEFLTNITIEPVLFIRYIADNSYKAVQQNFKLERFCLLDLNYTSDECYSMNDGNHTQVQDDAQRLDNDFALYEQMAKTILPLICVLFVGSWSDTNGRKIPICLTLGGYTLYMFVYMLVASFGDWSAQILLTGEFVKGAGGGDMMFLMTAYSFISDVTSTGDRLYRMGMMMSLAHLGMPLGTLIGALMYNISGYIGVFATSFALYILSIIYVLMFVKEKQFSGDGFTPKKKWFAIFSIRHPYNTLRFAFTKRPARGRAHLLFLICSTLFCMSSLLKNQYLWTQQLFNWDVGEYSVWLAVSLTYYQLTMLVLSPLVVALGIQDLDVGIFCSFTIMISNIWQGCVTRADQWWMAYASSAIAIAPMFPPIAARSAMSKICKDDVGKCFAFLALVEVIWELADKAIYVKVYDATLETYPSAQFLVEAAFCFGVMIVLLGLRVSMMKVERKRRPILISRQTSLVLQDNDYNR